MFRPFIFDVITNMLELKYAILLFYFVLIQSNNRANPILSGITCLLSNVWKWL